jgi:hypothetical protein
VTESMAGPLPERRRWEPARPTLGQRVDLTLLKLTLWLSPRSEAFGVKLYAVTLPPGMQELFFAKVRRALELIDRHEPQRLRRLRQDVSVIGGIAGGAHHYKPYGRAIMLSWPGVLQGTVIDTAMTIVHEATHGRLASVGIEYEEAPRSRIEGVCVAQEAAFARLLPGGEALAMTALKKLETPWWTPEEAHRWTMIKARAHKLPGWLLRYIEWKSRRHMRRAVGACTADSEPSNTPAVTPDVRGRAAGENGQAGAGRPAER